MTATIETDVLIVGAGPAGASGAAFLGNHGIPNVVISRHRSTGITPRAHITNQRTMKALRDAGLERECMAHASPPGFIENSFWLRSMAGEEIARVIADQRSHAMLVMLKRQQLHAEPNVRPKARSLGHLGFQPSSLEA